MLHFYTGKFQKAAVIHNKRNYQYCNYRIKFQIHITYEYLYLTYE